MNRILRDHDSLLNNAVYRYQRWVLWLTTAAFDAVTLTAPTIDKTAMTRCCLPFAGYFGFKFIGI